MADRELTTTGYSALLQMFDIAAMPHCDESHIAAGAVKQIFTVEARTVTHYPSSYLRVDTWINHLEFALKYEGVNLQILSRLFKRVAVDELLAYIKSKPTSQYGRRAWYLYEWLTGKTLPLEDLQQGNYFELLDPADYITATPSPIKRQRINDNLLGNVRFCPMVRRTKRLAAALEMDLPGRCQRVIEQYPLDLLRRALAYLYTKESKSSFEIEHIKADASRTERFVAQLRLAESQDFFEKSKLVDLQNRIVDARYADKDYRNTQNYVGESLAWKNERIHFVSPRPTDLVALMDGMYSCHARLTGIDPVIHAAIISYGFVFMHPFEDGNGRIHRFLIHNILSRRTFVPPGMIFPVSAVMLRKPADYDESLEAFSIPLMPLIDYALTSEGKMTVRNDTGDFYRYVDFTAQVEALFGFIAETIDTELIAEIRFLLNYDRAKAAIQAVVDMPDRLIDLFIKFAIQNNGMLSAAKRQKYFDVLNDEEVAAMEAAVRTEYGQTDATAENADD